MSYDASTDKCMRKMICMFRKIWSIRTSKSRFFVTLDVPPEFGLKLVETYYMMPVLEYPVDSVDQVRTELREKVQVSDRNNDRIRQIREFEHKALNVWRYNSERRKYKPNPAWIVLFIFCSLMHIPFPGELVHSLSSSGIEIGPNRSMKRIFHNKLLQRVKRANFHLENVLHRLCGLTTFCSRTL